MSGSTRLESRGRTVWFQRRNPYGSKKEWVGDSLTYEADAPRHLYKLKEANPDLEFRAWVAYHVPPYEEERA